jgi:serine/threonine-protein kinase RsbW
MKHEYAIASISTNVKIIDVILHTISKTTPLADAQLFELRLVLSEAITNAIRHGNDNNPEKTVYIRYTADESQLNFFISDEGEGFEMQAIDNPTSPEKIEKEGGRGVFLMKKLCNLCTYSIKDKAYILTYKI